MRSLGIAVALLACFCLVRADDPKDTHAEAKHVLVPSPSAVKWGPAPPALPPGAQTAVLVGDPSKEGAYVLRAKMPDGYKVPPHWHPHDENVTVLQGTLLMGRGETFDADRATAVHAGGFAHMPKGMRHFAAAQGDTVIQVHGTGPFEIRYVHPEDDPRRK